MQDAGHSGAEPLSPVAARLVAAARALLARGGFQALTVEAVASEAGAYRDAVRYHFGSKAALIAAVVDSLAHDQSLAAVEQTRELPSGPERVHALVAGDRQLVEDRDAFRDFFALLPHVVQDDDLRGRIAALYEWYRELYAAGIEGDAAGGPAGGPPEAPAASSSSADSPGPAAPADRRLSDIASLMVAVTDGLAVQELLDPDPGRLARLFRLWEELLQGSGAAR
jgi:AcrR family transcriptional regulator